MHENKNEAPAAGELEKLAVSFQEKLLPDGNILEILDAQYGIKTDAVRKYRIGWTGFDFDYKGFRYYRNCIAIPVSGPDRAMRNIRFRPIRNSQVSFENVLNITGAAGNITFYGNVPSRPRKYWLFENELEAIRVAQGLPPELIESVCVISPTARRAAVPPEWMLPGFFGDSPLTVFFDNSKAGRDRTRNIVQLVGDKARAVEWGSSRNIFDLFVSLGDGDAIKHFLKLEESAVGYTVRRTRTRQAVKSDILEPDRVKLINLNQDFRDGTAYYTVGLERLTEYKTRKDGHTRHTIVKDVVPYVVTSGGFLAEVDDNIAGKFGIAGYFPVCLPDSAAGWSLKSIRDFVQHGASVEADEVFVRTKRLFEDNFVFGGHDEAALIALWVIGTYLYRLFPVFPALRIDSDDSVCDRAADFLSGLVFNPWRFVETSKNELLSILGGYSPTALIGSVALRGNTVGARTMRQILEKGTATGVFMPQVKKEKGQLRISEIPVGCPKVVLGDDAGRLPFRPTRIVMKSCRREVPNNADFTALRDRFYHFAMKNWQSIAARIPDVGAFQLPEEWVTLAVVAELFGKDAVSSVRRLASGLSDAPPEFGASLQMKACLEALRKYASAENYRGYVYASDIAKEMQARYPVFRTPLNWRDALGCLRKLGFAVERDGKRSNRGYKILCSREDIAKIDGACG